MQGNLAVDLDDVSEGYDGYHGVKSEPEDDWRKGLEEYQAPQVPAMISSTLPDLRAPL